MQKPAIIKEFKMNQPNSSSTGQYTENAFRAAVVIFIANLLSTGSWLFVSWQFGAWQLYVLTGLLGVFSVVSAISMVVIRRGKTETGGWMVIAGIIILLAVGAFLYSGVALVAGISVVILANLVATQMLAPKSRRPGTHYQYFGRYPNCIAGAIQIRIPFISSRNSKHPPYHYWFIYPALDFLRYAPIMGCS
jgi:hypothetical protein